MIKKRVDGVAKKPILKSCASLGVFVCIIEFHEAYNNYMPLCTPDFFSLSLLRQKKPAFNMLFFLTLPYILLPYELPFVFRLLSLPAFVSISQHSTLLCTHFSRPVYLPTHFFPALPACLVTTYRTFLPSTIPSCLPTCLPRYSLPT